MPRARAVAPSQTGRRSTPHSVFLTAKQTPTQGTFGCKVVAQHGEEGVWYPLDADVFSDEEPTDTESSINLSICQTFLSSVCALADAPGEAGGIIAPVATAARSALDAYDRGEADSFSSFFDVFPTTGSIPQLSFVNRSPTSPLPTEVQTLLDDPAERKKYVTLDMYYEEGEPVRYVISPVRAPNSARSTPRRPFSAGRVCASRRAACAQVDLGCLALAVRRARAPPSGSGLSTPSARSSPIPM